MGKICEVLRVQLANKNNDEIVVYKEKANRRTIYKAEIYGKSEHNRFGSFELRNRKVFLNTYNNLRSLLDDLFPLLEKEKISKIIVYASVGTPFPYQLKEPGKKTFSEKYKGQALEFAYRVLTTPVEQVEVFFTDGKLIILHVEGGKARFMAPLLEDEFEDNLPSRKIAKSVSDFVKKAGKKRIDYVAKIRGKYLVITTDVRAFLNSLYALAYNKCLWR